MYPPPRRRNAGLLLHPTSLPSPYGIGDLGPAAYAWIDALTAARQTLWQVLPLGPTGYGDSPYQCLSAFAGNPLLISPELLVRDGLLHDSDLAGADFPLDRAEYETVIPFKHGLTALAADRFHAGAAPHLRQPFEEFLAREADWLNDFALFLALKEAHGNVSWLEWPQELIQRLPDALAHARETLADEIVRHQFRQFLFFRQWESLKEYASQRGVQLVGDVAIFVATDSSDVWTHPELFQLDEARRPAFVAGVPPDYFSATGQLWGNPLYDWDAHAQSGYAWWTARLRATLRMVDRVRLDHFRGFEAYWSVPAGLPTAETGCWVKGPGSDLLDVLQRNLGGLPLIAEDLGVITPEVEALRLRYGLPGMKILQFAFGGAFEERFLPHRHEYNTVVYTGTHDNDTTQGWYATLTDAERRFFHRYVPWAEGNAAWGLIQTAWASVAAVAIAPLQDVLELGTEARMNQPGRTGGFWRWRFRTETLTQSRLDRLAELTEVYGRRR